MSAAILEPLYRQVKRLMLKQIFENKWPVNERLPNEFSLAESFNVSQGTMRKALNELTAEGFLFREQGIGTFVSELNQEKSLYHFFRFSLNETYESKANDPTAELFKADIISADKKLAMQLGVETGVKLVYMQRTRSLGETQALFEKIYLPLDLFKRLELESVESVLGTSYLYQKYQSQFSVFIDKAKDRVYPEIAEQWLKEHLPGAHLVLRVERIAYCQNGQIAEYRTTWIDSKHGHYFANLSR